MNQPPGGPPGFGPPGQQPGQPHQQQPHQQQPHQQQPHPQQGQPQGFPPQQQPPQQQPHQQQPHPQQGQPQGFPPQQQPHQQQPQGQAPFGMPSGTTADRKAQMKGFAKSLLDFSFERETLISPRVLKVLYGIWLFMLVPAVLFLLYSWYQMLTWESWSTGEWDPQIGPFFISLIMFPLMTAAWVLAGRVIFERGILAFRNHDLFHEIRDALQKED